MFVEHWGERDVGGTSFLRVAVHETPIEKLNVNFSKGAVRVGGSCVFFDLDSDIEAESGISILCFPDRLETPMLHVLLLEELFTRHAALAKADAVDLPNITVNL